jgi:hypothetical protein
VSLLRSRSILATWRRGLEEAHEKQQEEKERRAET